MSLFEYLWDDRANCLLIAVSDSEAFDVVTVEWLNDGVFMTIGVGLPGDEEDGLFHIFAVALPVSAGVEPVILTVSGVSDADLRNAETGLKSERITLDADVKFSKADRTNWVVVAEDDGPSIYLLDADEMVPPNTISTIMESMRYGSTIGPAQNATGEGQGGTLRVRVMHPEGGEVGSAAVEIFAPDDVPVPETQVTFNTMRVVDHVLPALETESLDLESLSNKAVATIGSRRDDDRSVFFEVPGEGEDGQYLSYLDRMTIVTSPPATLVFEHNATQFQNAGRSGAMVIANGKDDYPYVDDGTVLDAVLAAQPPRVVLGNTDIINAYGDVGKPMQLSDLDFANEITASVYSELSYLIARRHGANGAQLTPVDLNQFLAAPSYFNLLAGLDPDRLSMNAPRLLSRSLSNGEEIIALKALANIALKSDMSERPRIKVWLDQIEGHSAYNACVIPFYPAPLDVIAAGIDPNGIDWGEVGKLAYKFDLEMRRSQLDALTRSGILPLSFQDQFVSIVSDDLEDDLADLDNLVEEAVEFCEHALSVSGLSRNPQFAPRDFLHLAEVKVPDAKSAKRDAQDRAYHWLSATLIQKLGDNTIGKTSLSVEPVLRRIAARLYHEFAVDFKKLSEIVRDYRLDDPATRGDDNIVSFDHSRSLGTAEKLGGSLSQPSHDDMVWLMPNENDPKLVADWKFAVRRQLEDAAGLKTGGPIEA